MSQNLLQDHPQSAWDLLRVCVSNTPCFPEFGIRGAIPLEIKVTLYAD